MSLFSIHFQGAEIHSVITLEFIEIAENALNRIAATAAGCIFFKQFRMRSPTNSPFPVEKWQDLQIRFDRRGRSIWTPNQHTPKEWFERILVDFTFWFFFQGSGELITADGKILPLREGTCLCMKPGMVLEVRQTGNDLLGDYYFHLDFSIAGKVLPVREWPKLPFHSEIVHITFFSQVAGRILRLLNGPFISGKHPSKADFKEAELLMKCLLMELARNECEIQQLSQADISRHQERVLSRVLSKLYDNPTHFHSVSDMAHAAGYSASHFRTLCVALTGKPPSEILIRARIERAKDLLIRSDLTVGMIAEQLSYENIYYFSRQFKDITGMPPSTYRQSLMG